MKKQFVKTSNFIAFQNAIRAVESRGAAEAGMLLVTGEAGYGKSHTVGSWAEQTGAIYLRANQDWTPHYFMTELAKELRVDTRGPGEKLFNRLVAAMVNPGGEPTPLVIDEADHTLHHSAAVLEKIRDFSDRLEMMVILVGMDQIQAKVSRHAQISSRIARVVSFGAATLQDISLTCDTLCEVKVEPALVAEILRQTGGRMREVMNAIAQVEGIALRNQIASIGMDAIGNRPLVHDWRCRSKTATKPAASRAGQIQGGF
ncbi:AAA family ATPase [Craterilacuibacter sinensis]|uniref:AAA family ATPase n=1 Tax=Craterilacuibacter sinensis TaxID=2686017 RepID=A0A845BMW4_9NEIS|nr:ATP-binding protein [Craterilacuibacter sinensis]MXR36740.1 AAA family ATPase [Craterilacuibacter sinensis]